MQLAQDNLDLAHACMLAAEQTLATSRTKAKVLSIKHARNRNRIGSELIYNQLQSAHSQTMIYNLAYRTAEAAYAKALESFHLQQDSQ
jgi:hypothetical protein